MQKQIGGNKQEDFHIIMSVRAVMGQEIINIELFKKCFYIWKNNLGLNFTFYSKINSAYTKDL